MMQIGTWVTQYSKGFWQIVDIKPKYADTDYVNDDGTIIRKGDLIGSWVLLKKGFTPKMRFRVDSDVVDSYWCTPVSKDILESINQHFNDNPKDFQKFIDTPFVEKPSICTTWLELTPEQVTLFRRAIDELPDLFTKAESLIIFEKYNLSQCFSSPPSRYAFVCEHTLWELDENYNPLYKKPKLKETQRDG